VERRPDPKDRRIWRLHLCPPAYPELCEIHRHRTAMARQLTMGIDPTALEAMIEVLVTMKTILTQEPRTAAPATLPAALPPTLAPTLITAREVA
jgi:hypothetical protein